MRKIVEVYEEEGRRVSRGLGCYELRTVSDLKKMVHQSAVSFGHAVAFKYNSANGVVSKSFVDYEKDINSLGTAFHHAGFRGKRIAIISENRYEWGLCYLAAINGVGVVVPLDKYLPFIEVQQLVNRGKVDIVCFSPAYMDMMMGLAESDAKLRFVCMSELAEAIKFDFADRFYSLQDLLKQGETQLAEGERSYIDAQIDVNALAVLLFTSGTTALSKAVMLSQHNLAANISSGTGILKAGPGDVHLSMLPLHHTFENTVGFLFMVHSGITIAYCEGIKHIAKNIHEFGVTILITVPLVLEGMLKKIQENIRKSGKEKLFSMMVRVSGALRRVGIDVRRKLFKKVFEALGPNLRLVVCGAAPLDPNLVIGFDQLGLRVLQGFGLTETSPMVAGTCDLLNIPGTLGVPIANVEVAIDNPDAEGMGEILVRGENVMMGYYEDEASTKECLIAGGWFRTGDLGSIDKKGIVRVTGRVKSMIVLGNGKKAFPEEFEILLNSLPQVKESFVWGYKAANSDVQICAKIVLQDDGRQFSSEERTQLKATFDEKIKTINKDLPAYKAIRYYLFTKEELIKTTTLKIKRPIELMKTELWLKDRGLEMRKTSGCMMD